MRDLPAPTAKHTPGPWQCYADLPSTEPNWHIMTNASRMRVLANVHIEPGNATDEANARLIAAAPDMLAALKDLSKAYAALRQRAGYDEGDESDTLGMAQAAIAKAEG